MMRQSDIAMINSIVSSLISIISVLAIVYLATYKGDQSAIPILAGIVGWIGGRYFPSSSSQGRVAADPSIPGRAATQPPKQPTP